MLHKQPSSKSQASKSWGPILGLRYFGPAKSGVREGRWGGFDCTSQEKAAHGHVVHKVHDPTGRRFAQLCAAGNLSVSFNLSPCNLTLVSLLPPRPVETV